MKRLLFSNDVFEDNAGKNYRKAMNYSMPALFLAALEIAFINSGHTIDSMPTILMWLVIIVTVVYIIPGMFTFPTAWFMRAGKTRLYRESFLEIEGKRVIYHKCTKINMAKPYEVVYEITQIKKVEESRKKYVIHGQVKETNTGNISDTIDIPHAFEDMDQISMKARYRRGK